MLPCPRLVSRYIDITTSSNQFIVDIHVHYIFLNVFLYLMIFTSNIYGVCFCVHPFDIVHLFCFKV